jgi:hypothetical protein
MRFLLKMAFWLGLVLVLLPSGGSQPAPKMPVNEAMSAAKAAVSDMRQFCERQAEACTIGSQAVVAIGHWRRPAPRCSYEFFNDQLGSGGDRVGDGDRQWHANARPRRAPPQHTLTPNDLAPTWRGSQPQRATTVRLRLHV